MERERVIRPSSSSRAARKAPSTSGASGVLALQRTAGNAAVASLVGAQRVPDEDELAPWDGGGADHAGETESAGTPAEAGIPQGAAPEGGAGAGGMNDLGSVARVGTLIADSIVAASYSPGAGNIW